MGVFTNFLKLLKPNPDDFYDVTTQQAENWQKVDNWAKGIDDSNKKKLDKGNVSVEYDTAKKIEDKIKEVKNTADSKLDKGAYQGNAQDLKEDIYKKVSKNKIVNDLMTGGRDNVLSGEMGKELAWKHIPKEIGNNSTYSDLNEFITPGIYYSPKFNFLWEHSPDGIGKGSNGEFKLIVLDQDPGDYTMGQEYKTQILIQYSDIYIRSCVGSWQEWVRILAEDTPIFLKNHGVDVKTYIQTQGQKEKGKGYYDKITNKLYLCLNTNNDTTVTSNFKLSTNIDINKELTDIFSYKYETGALGLKPEIGNSVTKAELIGAEVIQVTTGDVDSITGANLTDNYGDTRLIVLPASKKTFVSNIDQEGGATFSIDCNTGVIKCEFVDGNSYQNNGILTIVKIK